MNIILNKRNGKEQMQFVENNEKKFGLLEKILEKGKESISQYMKDKFQRLNNIRIKEEKIKFKRLREDIDIEKEKEIIRFEEEIKLIELRSQLKYIISNYEGLTKKEKIISLIEESEGENQDNANAQQKKNSKKKKFQFKKWQMKKRESIKEYLNK